jgi:hypothetical protein
VCLIAICLLPAQISALEFSSNVSQTTIVELYTSEGCSSCPPADKWLSSLKQDRRLFRTLIPMAFHVDYWDELGWPDRFASEDYSQRQREMVRQGILSQVYTPGFVVNSREWRGWFNGQPLIESSDSIPGVLSASLNDRELTVRFGANETLTAHVVILGMGLDSEVEAGENRGRTLVHDFVVLDKRQLSGQQYWQFFFTAWPNKEQQQTAIAVWLTKPGSHEVIQAAGGYLE